jgi:hypothetical protein
MLYDASQAALLSEIHSWPKFSHLKTHVAEYEKKLAEIEASQNELSKRERALKAEFAHGLAHCFKQSS